MIEIGAGGGSIAASTRLGLLKVGPHSRRRRSRPGLLRPRRHRADGHRRQPAARLLRPGFFLGGAHDARHAKAAAERAMAQAPRRAARALGDAEAAWGIARGRRARAWPRRRACTWSRRASDPRRYAMVGLRRRRPGACRPMSRASLGVRGGDRAAGLGRRLRARLPGRAAQSLRAGCARLPVGSSTPAGRCRDECRAGCSAELEARPRAMLRAAGVAGRRRSGRAARPTCAWSGQMHEILVPLPGRHARRPQAGRRSRALRARSTGAVTPRVYAGAADRGHHLPRRVRDGPDPDAGLCSGALGAATPAAGAQGQRAQPGSTESASRTRRSTTATRCGPATAVAGPGHHRGARGHDDRRRRGDVASPIDATLNLRIAVAAPAAGAGR
jgi:hypothetical protein